MPDRHLPLQVLGFDTTHVGRKVFVYDTVSSTNDVAAALAADPANDGTVVLAGHQSAGRGQYGRTWHGLPDASILMSVLLRPPIPLRRPVILTAWAAVGIADVVHELTGLQARIKWPNDLLLRGKKLSGILIEQASAVVAGIGLNVNQRAEDFAAAALPDATSLFQADKVARDRLTVLKTVLRRLDEEYVRLLAGEIGPLEAEWKWRVGLLGRQVVVGLMDNTTVLGRLLDLSFEGVELSTSPAGIRVIRPEQVRILRPA